MEEWIKVNKWNNKDAYDVQIDEGSQMTVKVCGNN